LTKDPDALFKRAWQVARNHYDELTAYDYGRPWPVNEGKIDVDSSMPDLSEESCRVAAIWLDKLIDGAKGPISAGYVRRTILIHNRISVPSEIIIAIALTKALSIWPFGHAVWIARHVEDEPVPF
jgi:hypothetical protein